MTGMNDPFRGSRSAQGEGISSPPDTEEIRAPRGGSQPARQTRVREIMTVQVQSCHPEDTLASAALAMSRADCRFLPVLDARNRPAGVITDGDVCLLGATDERRLRDMRVRDAMSHRVVTCHPDDDIHTVIETMRRERIRHLPVVDAQGALAGVVSLTDIIICAEEREDVLDPIHRQIAAAEREIAQKHPGGRAVRVHPFVED